MDKKKWEERRQSFHQKVNPKPEWEEWKKLRKRYEDAWKTPVQKVTDAVKEEMELGDTSAHPVMGTLSDTRHN